MSGDRGPTNDLGPCTSLRVPGRGFGHDGIILTACVLLAASGCGRLGFEFQALSLSRDASVVPFGGDAGLEPSPEPEPMLVGADAAADAGAQSSTPSDAGSPPDGVDDGSAMAQPPQGPLIHHYRFDGTGSAIIDSVGRANGELVGTTLTGTGDLTLPGGLSGPHVNLPSGMISSLESVTVEAWITWAGGSGYQRVFDFGNNDGGPGAQGNGLQNFSLALNLTRDSMRLLFDTDPAAGSGNWRTVFVAPVISQGSVHQVVSVFDAQAREVRLYVDGSRVGASAVPAGERLADINDESSWLGMAQWGADPNFAGTMHDVRIYDVPLSDTDVATRFIDRY